MSEQSDNIVTMPVTIPRMGGNSGQPLTRRDGIAKVTGTATYAYDNRPDGVLYAVTADAAIARGRVTGMNVEAARAHPGVVEVYSPGNPPPIAQDPDDKPFMFSQRFEGLRDDTVRYANQPIALVVAETLEAALEGARLLAPTYDVQPARIGFDGGETTGFDNPGFGVPEDWSKGDVDAGLAEAAHRTEATYITPDQYHNAMEPHAVVAKWSGDKLEIDIPNQAPALSTNMYGALFGIDPKNVEIRTPYLGGGFGSKAVPPGPCVLAIAAARALDRPVKLALRRSQMFGPVGHRGATRQTLMLGTDAKGALTALSHHSDAITSSFDDFFESAANASRNLYASPNMRHTHQGYRNDVGTPGAMRAPGEASGSAALECAMDEAALAAGIDPLEFRLINYAETDPQSGLPFSAKALRECYAKGAESFGWAGRPLQPRQMTDGDGLLVGWGMGTAQFPAPMFGAEARATLRADGTGLVETGAIDMGQGAWTALAQIAADALGLPVDMIEFRGGSSSEPDGGVAGGSGHTATAGLALHSAGVDTVGRLAELATGDPTSPLYGSGNAGVTARGGRLYRNDDESRSESYGEILSRAGLAQVQGSGKGARDPETAKRHAMFSHGAVFAEVKVDPDLGQVRVTRMTGAFAAGRIINPRLAASQLEGGMIWGLSFALHEGAEYDKRTGKVVNGDLAGYHVPVHADIPALDCILVDEDDPYVNALGIKGVGEMGVTGAVGAIANAIWHATGVRARNFPIHIKDLIG